jgi:hypothetical protein
MLIFFVVCAIGIPLMLWALSPGKSTVRTGHHPSGDVASLPPAAAAGFDAAPSCNAGSGGCDAG